MRERAASTRWLTLSLAPQRNCARLAASMKVVTSKHDTRASMAVGDGSTQRSAGDIESARVHAMAYEYLCHLEEARLWMQACLREAQEKEREESGSAPPPMTPEDRIMSQLGVKVSDAVGETDLDGDLPPPPGKPDTVMVCVSHAWTHTHTHTHTQQMLWTARKKQKKENFHQRQSSRRHCATECSWCDWRTGLPQKQCPTATCTTWTKRFTRREAWCSVTRTTSISGSRCATVHV
jgi:hypothetical protein